MGAYWWAAPFHSGLSFFGCPKTASVKLCERHARKISMSDATLDQQPSVLMVRRSQRAQTGSCATFPILFRAITFVLTRSRLRSLCGRFPTTPPPRRLCFAQIDSARLLEAGQVGWSQGRSGCCLESCSCPSRCPVCAPFATSFSLSVGSRDDPAACMQGYFSAGTKAPRCARPLGWPAQQVRRPPLPQRTLSGRRSRRQSRSPKRIRAQGRRAAEPPSAERVCAATAITAAASETAASEHARHLRARAPPPTPLPPSPPPPILQSRSRPFPPAPRRSPFGVGRSGQSRRRRLLFRRARRLRAERAASVPASTSSAGRLAVCGRSECCHASRGRSALIFPFLV